MSIQTQIDRIVNEVSTQTSLISQIVDELQGKSVGIIPSGELDITQNGAYDVTEYASANVNVEVGITPTGELEITENGTYDVTTYASANVNVEGLDTSDATATANDILSGKTAYVNGEKVTGKIATVTQPAPTISVSSSGLITASYPTNRGYTAYIDEMSSTKQLTTQSAQTITPSTSDKTITSGRYLTGTQTIKGDSNLVASNIKSGVSIFGVSGTYEGSGGSSNSILTVGGSNINSTAAGTVIYVVYMANEIFTVKSVLTYSSATKNYSCQIRTNIVVNTPIIVLTSGTVTMSSISGYELETLATGTGYGIYQYIDGGSLEPEEPEIPELPV